MSFRLGTPFEDQNEVNLLGKGLKPWQQQVKDERTGKKRFHGAFTGGFEAGYKNTCGSLQGFQPQSFISTRTSRAVVQQRVVDFMDDQDLGEFELGENIQAQDEFGVLNDRGQGNGFQILNAMRKGINGQSVIKKRQIGPTMPSQIDQEDLSSCKYDEKGLGYTQSEQNFTVDQNDSLPLGLTFKRTLKGQKGYKVPDIPQDYQPSRFLQNFQPCKTYDYSQHLTLKKRAKILQEEKEVIRPLQKFAKYNARENNVNQQINFTDEEKQQRFESYLSSKLGIERGGIIPITNMTGQQLRLERQEFDQIISQMNINQDTQEKPITITRTIQVWQPTKQLAKAFSVPYKIYKLENKEIKQTFENYQKEENETPLVFAEEQFLDLFKSIFENT